jgi:hypothetical protein
MDLDTEILDFVAARRREARESAQRAALQIVCGLDLQATLAGSRDQRQKALAKAERMTRRERHRGALGHWSYDLNRHIALKQVCERLRATLMNTEIAAREKSPHSPDDRVLTGRGTSRTPEGGMRASPPFR